MNVTKELERHIEAISNIVKAYHTDRAVVGMVGFLFNLIEGCQKTKALATDFILTSNTTLRIVDQLTDLLGHLSDKLKNDDFYKLQIEMYEINKLVCCEISNQRERICIKTSAEFIVANGTKTRSGSDND